MEDTPDTGRVVRRPRRIRNTLPFALTVAAAAAFSFLSGGYVIGRSSPVVVIYLLLAAVWVWFLRRRSRPAPLFLAGLAVLGLFVAWSGFSVLWSVGPDLSWVSTNLAAFYLCVVAVLGLTTVRSLQLRTAGYGFLAVAFVVGVYAFLGKGMPDVVTHAHIYARLDSPIGYWNVLALMMVMGLLVALALAGDERHHPLLRVVGAVAAVPLCFTFFFTFSRGGWVALAVGLVLYFVFTTTRLSSFASLVAIVAPMAVILLRLRGLDTLFVATTDDTLRAAQGHTLLRWALAAVLITAGVQLLIALVHRVVAWPRWSRLAAGTTILVVLVAGVGIGSARFLDSRGGTSWVRERVHAFVNDSDTESSGNAATRLVSVNTGRPPLWREALRQSRYDRVTGIGAGSFPFTHYRFRTVYGGVVKHAHNQWLNVLSELGVVGLVLFVVAVVLLVAAAVRNPFAGRRDPMRPLLVAMQASIVTFVLHMSWDWDWDMAAIGTVVFLFIAACSSYLTTRAAERHRAAARPTRDRRAEPVADVADAGSAMVDEGSAAVDVPVEVGRAPRRHRGVGWPVRVVASAALILVAVSWLPPYLSGRAENSALAASSEGHADAALVDARRAASLDPLAVDPLIIEALVLEQTGDNREALRTLRSAAALQPDNYEVWYHLGVLQLKAFGRRDAAVKALRHALALNPDDAASRYELTIALGT